jgi:hypothetical protein
LNEKGTAGGNEMDYAQYDSLMLYDFQVQCVICVR